MWSHASIQWQPEHSRHLHDAARDATTLALIPRAIGAGIPVFGICRGFQEVNVAMGGTLTQRLHEVPGLLDHRDDDGAAAGCAIRAGA
jgi:putative glutamine amidotransferase